MELSKIYMFGDKYSRGCVQYTAINDWNWPCSTETLIRLGGNIENKLYLFNMLQMGSYDGITFPLEFHYQKGKRYYDILCIGAGNLFLVSDRFIKVLEINQFTGWKSYPVRLFEKDGTEVFGYNGFSITGIAGKIHWELGEVVEITNETETYSYYKGVPIDMSKWDGSDFFLSYGSWGNFLTDRVYEVLKEAKITNIYFEKTTESLLLKFMVDD